MCLGLNFVCDILHSFDKGETEVEQRCSETVDRSKTVVQWPCVHKAHEVGSEKHTIGPSGQKKPNIVVVREDSELIDNR